MVNFGQLKFLVLRWNEKKWKHAVVNLDFSEDIEIEFLTVAWNATTNP